MKKILISLLIFSSAFFILSLLVFSSTSNTVSNRLAKLPAMSLPVQTTKPDNSQADTPHEESAFADVYGNPLPVKILPPEPDKVVYITIDDGPNPNTTPVYLDILEKNNVKATFFMVGRSMEKYPQLVEAIANDGHVIGNHSYTHNYSSVYESVYSLDEEISKTEEVILTLAGTQPKIFRAPGGSTNLLKKDGFVNVVRNLGYSFFDWNVSAADTSPRYVSKEEIIDNIKTQSQYRKRIIILMHDNGKNSSPESLNELIPWFREKGYEFAVLDEHIEPIYLNNKVALD